MFKVKTAVSGLLTAVLFCGCVSTPGKSARPDWISDPYKVYNKTAHIAAVGYGPARDTAEKNALAALTAIFGQSVSSETKSSYTYTQALEASGTAWGENSEIAQAVKTSVEMDSLIGAEIRDVWNGGDTYYAVAVMERAKTSLIYSEMIQTNLKTISGLTNLSSSVKRSFEGYGQYRKAARLADANVMFANVMKVVSPGSMAGESFKTGDDYRLEAAEIARSVPVSVIVSNDRQARIRSAFSQVLTGAGFLTGGNDSRYVLNVAVLLEEVAYPGNSSKFIRYTIDADLVDKTEGTVLFPYNISGREGHIILSEAENRAIRAAEDEIKKSYVDALGDYLATTSAGGRNSGR
jgi:hypothetical protein